MAGHGRASERAEDEPPADDPAGYVRVLLLLRAVEGREASYKQDVTVSA
jgi:hypothetical protein